jgi:hypothetical protein
VNGLSGTDRELVGIVLAVASLVLLMRFA